MRLRVQYELSITKIETTAIMKFIRIVFFVFCLLVILFNPSLGQEVQKINSLENNSSYPKPLNMPEVQRLIGYPKEALAKGVQGEVVFKVFVDETGKYVKHEIISEGNSILLEACEEHVSKLVFTPATNSKGEKIKSSVSIPFNFKLLNTPTNGGDISIEMKEAWGQEAFEKGNYEKALEHYKWAFNKKKNHVFAYLMMGACYNYLDHPWTISTFSRSLKMIRKLKKKNPQEFKKQNPNLGRALKVMEEIKEKNEDQELENLLTEIISEIKDE